MKLYLKAGERVCKVMPFSEVCMHMRIADKEMMVELTPNGMAQLFKLDGSKFSFPVTLGEAGLYTDEGGVYVLGDSLGAVSA